MGKKSYSNLRKLKNLLEKLNEEKSLLYDKWYFISPCYGYTKGLDNSDYCILWVSKRGSAKACMQFKASTGTMIDLVKEEYSRFFKKRLKQVRPVFKVRNCGK